jgi:hypothetical protein
LVQALSNRLSSAGYWYAIPSSTYGTSIYRTCKPLQPLIKLETNFWPTEIFALDNLVDVVGYFYPHVAGRPHNASGCDWTLLRFKHSTMGCLEKYAEIPVKGVVVDVDQRDQLFLGSTGADFFPSWFLYNMTTGEKKRIGRERGNAMFLAPSLAKILNDK